MKRYVFKLFILLSALCIHTFGVIHSISYAVVPFSNNTYRGIDVSAYQGFIDYSKVKNAGIQVVYIKASEGTTLVDPYFRTNYDNAKSQGLKIGFYHFVRARNMDEAEKEAMVINSVISVNKKVCIISIYL